MFLKLRYCYTILMQAADVVYQFHNLLQLP